MPKAGSKKKIKALRLDVTISPIHNKKMFAEIKKDESRGMILTNSDIIRQALERRYKFKKK